MVIAPVSPEELADCLAEANLRNRQITLCGNSTKDQMGGPIAASDLTLSTRGLGGVLEYNPRDLTISVGAGITYCELTRVLAEHRQMVPLDPPFFERATVGGTLAANVSGPRRRLYGTARDMVIGMTFATLDGKLVKTGGMVVKNVAGLDMGKLLIGSFGTLAAIATVNFRIHPMPQETRTFTWEYQRIDEVLAARNQVLKSSLQPTAIDILKSASSYQLLIQAGGSPAVLGRYSRELPGAKVVEGTAEEALWQDVRELTPAFLRKNPNGAVVRVSCLLSEMGSVLEAMPGQALVRAGSGVCYGYFEEISKLRLPRIGQSVIEFAPPGFREQHELWPHPQDDFAMMKKIKDLFDPNGLLNSRRLYGRI
jgi:glycolate oxidase FAD binding subunit